MPAEIIISSGITSTGLLVESEFVQVRGGTVIETTVNRAGSVFVSNSGVAVDTVVNYWGEVYISSGGFASGATVNSSGLIRVSSGGSIFEASVNNYGKLELIGDAVASDNMINSRGTMSVYGGAVALTNNVNNWGEIYVADGGIIIDNQIDPRGIVYVSSGGVAKNNVLSSRGELRVYDGGSATHSIVGHYAYMAVGSGASIDDTTIFGGGYLELESGAKTGDRVTMDFTGVSAGPLIYQVLVNDLSLISPETEICVTGMIGGKTYMLSLAGTDRAVTCVNGLYHDVLEAGESYTNPLLGITYTYDGANLSTTVAVISEADIALPLTSRGWVVNGVDLAARWTGNTQYVRSVYLTEGMTEGDAWLKIDGFTQSPAIIFGTAKGQNFSGTVNINADNGVIKNLAGGAALGGTVGNVKITVGADMITAGAFYAGGMGNVTGKTETLVNGGQFLDNVFAGALCNYAANKKATSGADMAFTAAGGTFNKNLYAGAAVKAGAATTVVHTAGDISVELSDGAAAKQDFCLYGGGHAGGSAEGALVYTAGNVDISISGGSWGGDCNGRGIFGGVYTDTVAASVEDVTITVLGGKMGNVYGGGWAQQGGSSFVNGTAVITIAGDAEVANVFGGGRSSNSGGTTRVGKVSITVAGGDISGSIYAGGKGSDNNKVDGDIDVKFTGENSYSCNVYGCGGSIGGGAAMLMFDDYAGTLSGKIGGFDEICFTGDSGVIFDQESRNIENGMWMFDLARRDAALSNSALLGWNSGDFSGDDVVIRLDDAASGVNSWTLAAGVDGTGASFAAEVDGDQYFIGYGERLDVGCAYDGWGFITEGNALKFKLLA